MAVLNNLSNEPGRTPLTKAKPVQSVRSFDEKERENPPSPSIQTGNRGDERPFTNIVVAFNGSQESKRALELAARLVRITGASLQTITVLNPLPAYTAYATAIDAAVPALLEHGVHEAYKRLQEEARQIAMNGGATVMTHLIESGDAKSIIRFISEVGADLLVIGIHRHRLQLSCLWSTAHDLAQHAACSVLGVP
jgi:nucleotide-binding universal stress UspA family protein